VIVLVLKPGKCPYSLYFAWLNMSPVENIGRIPVMQLTMKAVNVKIIP